jgi:hypothetical protein
MAQIIFRSEPHPSGGCEWIIEQDPLMKGNLRMVRFLRRTSQRKVLDQIAEWLPPGTWNHKRWAPRSPTVPQWLLLKVENHMRRLD